MRTFTTRALLFGIALTAAVEAAAQGAAARKLQLTFDENKRVSLAAQHVTVSEILAEWARRCGCYVVNADKLTGAPLAIPVQFDHAGQAEVLGSLLRQASGYVLTPSRTATAASIYETIYIIPTGVPASAIPSYSSATSSSVAVPITTQGAPDDEIPPVVPERQPPPPTQPAQNPPPRPAAPGVSVPLTTVSPFVPTITPQPQAPAPARGGTATPPR